MYVNLFIYMNINIFIHLYFVVYIASYIIYLIDVLKSLYIYYTKEKTIGIS